MASHKIVLADGVFDIFHVGHLRYLQAASQMGDRLVVSVTRNAHVNKGPGRPLFDEWERAAIIRALRCVRQVILVNDSLEALEKVRPHIFVKGQDYRGKIKKIHSDYCKEHHIEIAFTDEVVYSATKIINDRFKQSQRA